MYQCVLCGLDFVFVVVLSSHRFILDRTARISVIQNVDRGLRYLPHGALDRLAERMPAVDLTPREAEVLAGITRGRSNREIAEDLKIAEKTVRIHVSSLLDKMGARDRTQATIYALQRGLVHLD